MALGDPCRGDPGTKALASQGDLLTRRLPRSDLQARWILSLERLCGFRFDSFQMLPHIGELSRAKHRCAFVTGSSPF